MFNALYLHVHMIKGFKSSYYPGQDQKVFIKGFKSSSYPRKTRKFLLKVSNVAVIPARPESFY